MTRDHSFKVLMVIWLLVTLPLAWLAAWELEMTTRSLQGAGAGESFPILTRWYQALGTSGMYLAALVPGLLGLGLRPYRQSPVALITLTGAVAVSIYFVALGLLAALLAYVKVSF